MTLHKKCSHARVIHAEGNASHLIASAIADHGAAQEMLAWQSGLSLWSVLSKATGEVAQAPTQRSGGAAAAGAAESAIARRNTAIEEGEWLR